MRKIIIFGGSFDPIHVGHVKIAKNAFQKIKADKVFFVLSFKSPDKKNHRASWTERKEMLEIAISGIPLFEISEYEKNNNETSFTWKTIEYFREKYPNDQLFLLIGSDQYNNFHNWENIDYIKKNSKIICYSRVGFPSENNENIVFIDEFKIFCSSSSLILNPNNMLDKNVLDYINKNSIYALYRLRKEGISAKRIKHSIEVANLAIQFAKIFGEEMVLKAYASGIYHDIAKELSKDKLIKYSKYILNYVDYPNWRVIHAPLGKYIIKNKYKYNDEEILNAISYHTIPNDDPTILEKIIFCADKLSPREEYETNYDLINLCQINISKGFDILQNINKERVKEKKC